MPGGCPNAPTAPSRDYQRKDGSLMAEYFGSELSKQEDKQLDDADLGMPGSAETLLVGEQLEGAVASSASSFATAE